MFSQKMALIMTTLALISASVLAAGGRGSMMTQGSCAACTSAQTFTESLSEAEIMTLWYMREEEKMARDIYISFYEQGFNLPFARIARSEQMHMNRIKWLLDGYELSDPALETVGAFTNSEIQQLYDQLLEQGRGAQAEALQVGALVEEIDISDLQAAIAETENPKLINVYNHLLRASYQHLRTFVSHLDSLDINYEAQFLSSEQVEAILNSTQAQFQQGLMTSTGPQGHGAMLSQTEEITLTTQFMPTAMDTGQPADIVATATFMPQGSTHPLRLMRIQGGHWEQWDGELTNLKATETTSALNEQETLTLFQGQLQGMPGQFKVQVGYRNAQGEVILDENPLEFSVE